MTGVAETLPLVAIVGRPNVGKSALFNRLAGQRKAVVEDEPGTTRDRNYVETEWRGRAFRLVDTGGLMGEAVSGPYATPISEQVGQALREADVICFVVDAQTGPLPLDEDVAALLRDVSQPVFLVVNKADNPDLEAAATEFYALGLGDPFPVSAIHARGAGDLLDLVLERLPERRVLPGEAACRLAIVGRPNVGKSSLINTLLGQERMIVSPIPGTTRDAVDTPIDFEGQRLVLVDTAGIRRRGRIEPGAERHSVGRATAALERADVAAVVLDGSLDITNQDQHVLGLALETYRGVILVMNKVDLLHDDPEAHARRERQLRWRSRFLPWAPVVWTSAATGEGLNGLLRTALMIAAERQKRVPTAALNALLRRVVAEHPPGFAHGRAVNLLYGTQADVAPPTFVFFANYPEAVHFSYRRHLEKELRAAFGFEGVAMRLIFRKRSEPHA